jgi:hypothetical protein
MATNDVKTIKIALTAAAVDESLTVGGRTLHLTAPAVESTGTDGAADCIAGVIVLTAGTPAAPGGSGEPLAEGEDEGGGESEGGGNNDPAPDGAEGDGAGSGGGDGPPAVTTDGGAKPRYSDV